MPGDEHQVENRGDQHRITLYKEAPLTDELFWGHVKRALELRPVALKACFSLFYVDDIRQL
jgi:hypothetical protein